MRIISFFICFWLFCHSITTLINKNSMKYYLQLHDTIKNQASQLCNQFIIKVIAQKPLKDSKMKSSARITASSIVQFTNEVFLNTTPTT